MKEVNEGKDEQINIVPAATSCCYHLKENWSLMGSIGHLFSLVIVKTKRDSFAMSYKMLRYNLI